MMYVCVVELCCDVCVCVWRSCVVMMYVCVVELCCDICVCAGAML